MARVRRRALLAIAAATTSSGLAGCLDVGSDDGMPTGTEEPDGPGTSTEDDTDTGRTPTEDPAGETPTADSDESDTPMETDTPAETEDGTPGETRLVDQEMEIKSVECGGSGEDHWEVDVDDGVVTVDGEIGGNNACYSARIDSAEYDREGDVLRTTIESYDDSRDGEACGECIVDVHYLATFTFEDGEPGDVEVQHDGLDH